MKNIAIGIDIGGTSIKGASINKKGEVLKTFSMPINHKRSQEETIFNLNQILLKFLKDNDYKKDNVLGIGIGIPGVVDVKTGIVSYSNNLCWKNLHIQKMIEEATDLPVRITNDANAATLGEAKFGVGKKYKNLLMLTLGTGVGGGIIIDGKIYEGNLGKGAELGHQVIVVDGEECTCGRKGCLEAYASATALIRDTKHMIKDHQDSLLSEIANSKGKVDASIAFLAAKQGDKYGNILVNNYVKYLGEGLLNLFNIFRPEAVVLSGGIANEGEYLNSKLFEYCKQRYYGFRTTPSVKIINAILGYDAGKIGAASLFF